MILVFSEIGYIFTYKKQVSNLCDKISKQSRGKMYFLYVLQNSLIHCATEGIMHKQSVAGYFVQQTINV